MRKALGVLILLLAGATSAFAQTSPSHEWRTEPLRFRTSVAGVPGYADSTLISLTAAGAELDTSLSITSRIYPHMSVPDSLQNIIVWGTFWEPGSNGTTAGAFDSGDTVYVAIDASNDNGQTWRSLNPGIGINGFGTGQTLLGTARANTLFCGKVNSTTNVTGRSPVVLPTTSYGGWFGYTLLRVRTMTSAAVAGPIQAKLFITYPTQAR